MLLFMWFLYGAPGKGHAARRDTDTFMVSVASVLLIVGLFLPVLICILPRKQYIRSEVAFDVFKIVVVMYATSRFGFTNSSLFLTVLNVLGTGTEHRLCAPQRPRGN